MKKLVLIIMSVCLFNLIPATSQVNRAAAITNSDFRPGLQFMGGLGVNCSIPGFSRNTYIGLEGSFSLGSFENPLNLEFLIKPTLLASGIDGYIEEECEIDCICPFIIAPRWNLCRVAKNTFYMYIQPEIGYAKNAGWVYGGRLGLGSYPLGSLYMEALGASKILREGTYLASNFLFFSIGYSFHFW